MTDILLSLHQDHTNLGKLLKILEREWGLLESGKKPDYGLLGEILDYFLHYPDAVHHPKEDLLLKAMRTRDEAAAQKLNELLPEHVRLSEVTQELHAHIDAVRQSGEEDRIRLLFLLRRFIDKYWSHMEMEEAHFFPSVRDILKEEDWADIDAALADPGDPVFASADDERFGQLRFEILKADGARG
jgi:hemerythrin-like domain-containing protein